MELICVQSDTAYQAMVWIYDSIVNQSGDTVKEIHWFLNDVCPKDLWFNDSDNRHRFYECCPRTILNMENDAETNNANLMQLLRQKATDPTAKKTAVVIDSFSTLSNEDESVLMNSILREIYTSRRSTTRDSATQLFVTLRENARFNATALVKHLKYLANVWSTITNHRVYKKVKKSSGRITKEVYEYSDDSCNFALVKKVNVSHSKRETITDDNLCSFKLDLTDQEKEARNAVQLPYVRNSDDDGDKMSETRIHYNPDESDDWDEEEPDNDLEFV